MRIANFGGWISGRGPLALLLACVGGGAAIFAIAKETGAVDAPTQSTNANWALTWSDEFDAPDGSAPDPKKWTAETGGGGWGNNELEYYTGRRTNSRVEKGKLVIEALQEKFTGPEGTTREYTSARLKTEKLFTQKYGKFEARIRVPKGQGIWPAFWMLGDDISTAGWPACGEIDIMENVGFEPATVHGTIHGPGIPATNRWVRRTLSPAATPPMIFTFSASNGSQKKFAFMLTASCTKPERRPIFRRALAGCSITRFSSF